MKVFISHSSEDQRIAYDLADNLRASGIDVWRDDEIFPGSNWAMEVGKRLEDSDLMVVLVTPNSSNSEWVNREVQYAMTSGDYKGRVVPVVIGDSDAAGLPWVLKKMQAVQVEPNQSDWREVVQRIRDVAA